MKTSSLRARRPGAREMPGRCGFRLAAEPHRPLFVCGCDLLSAGDGQAQTADLRLLRRNFRSRWVRGRNAKDTSGFLAESGKVGLDTRDAVEPLTPLLRATDSPVIPRACLLQFAFPPTRHGQEKPNVGVSRWPEFVRLSQRDNGSFPIVRSVTSDSQIEYAIAIIGGQVHRRFGQGQSLSRVAELGVASGA